MRQLTISKQITQRSTDSVDRYLAEISKIPLLTPEEETILAQKKNAATKNSKEYKEAIDGLVNGNLRFVVSVAKQYQHQGLELLELINEGNFGLIKAAERFDETKGFKFISYAVRWIRQSIFIGLADQGRMIRLPVNKLGNLHKINKVIEAFEHSHERYPSIEEISDVTQLETNEIEMLLSINTKHTSLDAEIGGGDESDKMTLGDLITTTQKEIFAGYSNEGELREEVLYALGAVKFKGIEREVMLCNFGIGQYTIQDIIDNTGYTSERIRQILGKAKTRINTCKEFFAILEGKKHIHPTNKSIDTTVNMNNIISYSYINKSNTDRLEKQAAKIRKKYNKSSQLLNYNDNDITKKTTNQIIKNLSTTNLEDYSQNTQIYMKLGHKINHCLDNNYLRELHLEIINFTSIEKTIIKKVFHNFGKYGNKSTGLRLNANEIIDFTCRQHSDIFGKDQCINVLTKFLDSISKLESL